jgi:hypothetical protein
MKITQQDVNSLNFAVIVLGQVKEQSLNERQRRNLEIHQHRVRKCYLILLNCARERQFDFLVATDGGIPDNSSVANGIRTLTPKSEDGLELD